MKKIAIFAKDFSDYKDFALYAGILCQLNRFPEQEVLCVTNNQDLVKKIKTFSKNSQCANCDAVFVGDIEIGSYDGMVFLDGLKSEHIKFNNGVSYNFYRNEDGISSIPLVEPSKGSS